MAKCALWYPCGKSRLTAIDAMLRVNPNDVEHGVFSIPHNALLATEAQREDGHIGRDVSRDRNPDALLLDGFAAHALAPGQRNLFPGELTPFLQPLRECSLSTLVAVRYSEACDQVSQAEYGRTISVLS